MLKSTEMGETRTRFCNELNIKNIKCSIELCPVAGSNFLVPVPLPRSFDRTIAPRRRRPLRTTPPRPSSRRDVSSLRALAALLRLRRVRTSLSRGEFVAPTRLRTAVASRPRCRSLARRPSFRPARPPLRQSRRPFGRVSPPSRPTSPTRAGFPRLATRTTSPTRPRTTSPPSPLPIAPRCNDRRRREREPLRQRAPRPLCPPLQGQCPPGGTTSRRRISSRPHPSVDGVSPNGIPRRSYFSPRMTPSRTRTWTIGTQRTTLDPSVAWTRRLRKRGVGLSPQLTRRLFSTRSLRRSVSPAAGPTWIPPGANRFLLHQTRFPSTETREEVGLQIGMSARRVQIWFQNVSSPSRLLFALRRGS